MATTTTLRNWWAPACRGPFTRLTLHGGGAVTVRTTIVAAVRALDDCLRVADYRTRTADTGAYNCRKITGGTGYSLHAYGIAVDLNWQSNPYGKRLVTDMPPAMVADIKAIRTRNGKRVWRWGGDYSGNKDAMHFEVICHPTDMATGIDPASLPRRAEPTNPPEDPIVPELEIIKAFADWLDRPPSDEELANHTAYAAFHGMKAAVLNIARSREATELRAS